MRLVLIFLAAATVVAAIVLGLPSESTLIFSALKDGDESPSHTSRAAVHAMLNSGDVCEGSPEDGAETTIIDMLLPNYEDGVWYAGCRIDVLATPAQQTFWRCYAIDDDTLEVREIARDTPCEQLDVWPRS